MITARNYAAQAVRGLKENAVKLLSNSTTKPDYDNYLGVITLIEEAQHFAIPDDGFIFDDNFKGIMGKEIRLPYDNITLEFSQSIDQGTRKIVIWCYELSRNSLSKLTNHCMKNIANSNSERFILIMGVFTSKINNKTYWDMLPVGWLLSDNFDKKDPNLLSIPYSDEDAVYGSPFVLFPAVAEYIRINNVTTAEIIKEETIRVIAPVLEFIEALSCSNIAAQPIEQIDHKKNVRRVKDGKLPIYETKILTIKSSSDLGKKENIYLGGTHRSPRQHLRRGHIRRLEDKNIWVNSCVVGKAEQGVIKKDYQVIN